MFELIFDIVDVVLIDLCLVFNAVIITRLFLGTLFGSQSFAGQSLLLSTTVLNDMYILQNTIGVAPILQEIIPTVSQGYSATFPMYVCIRNSCSYLIYLSYFA